MDPENHYETEDNQIPLSHIKDIPNKLSDEDFINQTHVINLADCDATPKTKKPKLSNFDYESEADAESMPGASDEANQDSSFIVSEKSNTPQIINLVDDKVITIDESESNTETFEKEPQVQIVGHPDFTIPTSNPQLKVNNQESVTHDSDESDDILFEVRPIPVQMARNGNNSIPTDVTIENVEDEVCMSSKPFPSNSDNGELLEEVENSSIAKETSINSERLPDVIRTDDKDDSIQLDSIVWDNFSPKHIAHASKEYLPMDGNFLKGCKWSPDGLCLLTCSNDNYLRVYNLPTSSYKETGEESEEMLAVLQMKEGETIYDYEWYPEMSSYEAASCCLVSTCRDHPIHLWDAYDGQLRCSYRAFNHLDEIVSSNSVAFNPDGSKIYAGYSNTIRIFNTTRPGRECTEITLGGKGKSKAFQQKGIISCIASSEEHGGLYALGSFAKSVGVYSEKDNSPLFVNTLHQGGVTMLKFSPDGYFLYSGSRKDSAIHCWDLRYFGHTLFSVQRKVETNQRIQFDLSRDGNKLLTGETNGVVSVHDVKNCLATDDFDNVPQPKILFSEKLHRDCVNGLSVHPSLPLLATSSGQRHYCLPDVIPDDDIDTNWIEPLENTVKVWKCI